VPAAAVIPAPIAYIKVAAFKKLVVGSRFQACGPPRGGYCSSCVRRRGGPLVLLTECLGRSRTFTLKKLECSKQAYRLNNSAWNNGIGPRFQFRWFANP
jgi:hypothetical protein